MLRKRVFLLKKLFHLYYIFVTNPEDTRFVTSMKHLFPLFVPIKTIIKMKTIQIFLVLAAWFLSFGNLYAQRIKGSDTVLPIAQQTAEEFMKIHPEARVTVTGGGSGVGISALLDGTADLAMASRSIKFSEKMRAKAAGKDIRETIIAGDALAVVVHPDNPVDRLTRQQLEDIFRGKIINWKEVGGEDRKIVVYSRETSSGTYEFFKESVLKNKNYMAGSLSMPATGAVIQSVSQTRGAIGYVGLAYVSHRVKPLAVAYEGGEYAQPTPQNATNGTYPIVRPLYYYYEQKNADRVAPLLDYILSSNGQAIIKGGGYIPVKP